jgi:excisionase family DNA binding protein
MLNIAQVAEKLQVSEGLVRKWIGSGELSHYRLGNRIRIAEAELDTFLESRRKGPRIAQL